MMMVAPGGGGVLRVVMVHVKANGMMVVVVRASQGEGCVVVRAGHCGGGSDDWSRWW